MLIFQVMGLNIKSVRFNRYYTNRETIKKFWENTKIYLIPKKNSTIRGSPEWKKMLIDFIENTFGYLKEYYKRGWDTGRINNDGDGGKH